MERLLKSRYKIKDKIGESPFSVTYMGAYLDREDQLVIKIYKRSVLSSPIIKSVKKKMRELCNIFHPNIAKVIDGDYGWQGFYFVREFIKGKTLAQHLSENPKLRVEEATTIILQVLEALSVAHEKGIIHGALNPNNIFLTEGGIIKVADFTVVGELRSSVNERAQAVRELTFLSPEEVAGDVPTASTDIFYVGLLLYIMLAGTDPFSGRNALETSFNTLKGNVPEPSKLSGEVPEYLSRIIMKSLEKDPLMRFHNVRDLMTSIKTRNVVDNIPGTSDIPEVTLGSIIDTVAEKEEKKQEKKKEGPKLLRLILAIFIAVLFGIGYAVFNAITGK